MMRWRKDGLPNTAERKAPTWSVSSGLFYWPVMNSRLLLSSLHDLCTSTANCSIVFCIRRGSWTGSALSIWLWQYRWQGSAYYVSWFCGYSEIETIASLYATVHCIGTHLWEDTDAYRRHRRQAVRKAPARYDTHELGFYFSTPK